MGGTGLYFRAFLQGLSPLPRARDDVRRQLTEDTKRLGLPAMHRRLAAVDPLSAQRIHATDPQRIQRALEVYALTGRPRSEQQRGRVEHGPPGAFGALVPGSRDWLHRQIAERFHRMLRGGLIDEACALTRRPELHCELPALRAVGYRQVIEGLAAGCSEQAIEEQGVIATRQLARRQLTWLRRQRVDVTIEPTSKQAAAQAWAFVARWRSRLAQPDEST